LSDWRVAAVRGRGARDDSYDFQVTPASIDYCWASEEKPWRLQWNRARSAYDLKIVLFDLEIACLTELGEFLDDLRGPRPADSGPLDALGA
jgi:hypothetical protein